MEASLEKQRASVRRQVLNATEVSEAAARSWFTIPWEPAATPALATPGAAPDCGIELPPARLDELIEANAMENKLSPILLREVIRQESSFQPCAVSAKGAMGLMQLMPETAAGFGVADAFEPASNLAAGAKFLAGLIERYKGDSKLALAAYNAGVERVTQYRGVPPFPETENYIKVILGRVEAATPPPEKPTAAPPAR
jgi:soluble lytic murein transglycosylase-like protein